MQDEDVPTYQRTFFMNYMDIGFDNVIGRVIWQPYCFFEKKPSKIFFSEMVKQIEAKLYKYDRLSMGNKSFTRIMMS